ncbi:MAG: sigma-70 family RNA polymerase sigma factor [Erysipelotrichaceae bacterium]|nr:sigma-70 family RNA polymerase sigma factor [Erysipelotrichaceae bacterium]
MEDFDIVKMYWDRDEDAIYHTDRKYNRYCSGIAYSILFNAEDTKECVNETWLKAWQTIPPQRPEKLGPYLGKITRNLALNIYEKLTAQKRGGRHVDVVLDELSEVIGEQSDVEKYIDEKVLTELIAKFLRQQNEIARKVFVRRYWYMSSTREIARSYGLTDSNVKVMLKRTREKLKEYLVGEGYEL